MEARTYVFEILSRINFLYFTQKSKKKHANLLFPQKPKFEIVSHKSFNLTPINYVRLLKIIRQKRPAKAKNILPRVGRLFFDEKVNQIFDLKECRYLLYRVAEFFPLCHKIITSFPMEEFFDRKTENYFYVKLFFKMNKM